ncbi:hypothetical protein OPW33_22760 [Vibrio europaeus]|uniref:hypothetical protein n=1 Tax=Vibrio europaeus TaxID=300876 RepID=UPI002340994C|nr:hypothetical protein [Vibrio europaeus]MDC5842152.1 hypothetical protein [Vibrio europaeus]
MKSKLCFIPDSFSFDSGDAVLIEELDVAASLVDGMNSDFISFARSSDFDEFVGNELYCSDKFVEIGPLYSAIYDGDMNKAVAIGESSEEVLQCVNTALPTTENYWLSVYSSSPDKILVNFNERNITDEESLLFYSKHILLNNQYTAEEYGNAFKSFYKNLIFHQNYNDISSIESGCRDFINGILEMFDVMDAYSPVDGGAKTDIDYLNKNITFLTCEEGGGKKNRTTDEKNLKFNFLIDGKERKINCEFHCKLEYVDGQYKKGKYHKANRMYFGFWKPEDSKNQITIAHLGGHL